MSEWGLQDQEWDSCIIASIPLAGEGFCLLSPLEILQWIQIYWEIGSCKEKSLLATDTKFWQNFANKINYIIYNLYLQINL